MKKGHRKPDLEAEKRLLRRVQKREAAGYGIWLRREYEFRIAERLVKTGKLYASISKYNFFRPTGRPFRELEVSLHKEELLRVYGRLLPPSKHGI